MVVWKAGHVVCDFISFPSYYGQSRRPLQSRDYHSITCVVRSMNAPLLTPPLAAVLNQIHHCILNRSSHATFDFCIAAIAYLSSGWYSFLQQYFRVLVPRRLRQGQHASNLSCPFCSRRTNKSLRALGSLGTFIQIDFKLELITSSTVPPMRPWKSAGSYGTKPYWDTVFQAKPMSCSGSIRPLNMLLAVPSDQ